MSRLFVGVPERLLSALGTDVGFLNRRLLLTTLFRLAEKLKRSRLARRLRRSSLALGWNLAGNPSLGVGFGLLDVVQVGYLAGLSALRFALRLALGLSRAVGLVGTGLARFESLEGLYAVC